MSASTSLAGCTVVVITVASLCSPTILCVQEAQRKMILMPAWPNHGIEKGYLSTDDLSLYNWDLSLDLKYKKMSDVAVSAKRRVEECWIGNNEPCSGDAFWFGSIQGSLHHWTQCGSNWNSPSPYCRSYCQSKNPNKRLDILHRNQTEKTLNKICDNLPGNR